MLDGFFVELIDLQTILNTPMPLSDEESLSEEETSTDDSDDEQVGELRSK